MKKSNDISFLIESQFPAIYKEEGQTMVQFVKAYYEFVGTHHSANRELLASIDVDETSEEFVKFFKRTYLKEFPFVSATDARFLVKHIIDYYRSKGTLESTKLLIRLLFGEEADVYLPSTDVLKPSDSMWFVPQYIEVSRSPRSVALIGRRVSGSRTRAKAIVEAVVTKRVNGKYIDVLYISDVQGLFKTGDRISDGSSLRDAPVVLGSLNGIAVVNGGRDNKVGDVFDVIGTSGRKAKARVSSVFDETGRVDFNLAEGGSGYTTTDRTDVLISDAVLTVSNPTFAFIRFEKIMQRMETLSLLSVANIQSALEPGKFLVGVNENGVAVANGTIVDLAYSTEEGNLTASAKMMIHSGTFDRQERITLTQNRSFLPGEILEEESTTVLSLQSPVGTFNVGSRIEQALKVDYESLSANLTLSSNASLFTLRETVAQFNSNNELAATAQVVNITGSVIRVRNIRGYAAPGTFTQGVSITGTGSGTVANVTNIQLSPETQLYTSFAFGFIQSYNQSTGSMTLRPSWGTFEPGIGITAYANTDVVSATPLGTSAVSSVSVTEAGARSRVTTQANANTIIVDGIFGSMTVGKSVRGAKSRRIGVISSLANEGATDVWLNGTSTANGVIDLVANTTAQGIVIGQNATSVGVHGNTAPFFSSGQISIAGSAREVASLIAQSNNTITVVTATPHSYVVGDFLLIEISLQQNGEVKSVDGIFSVLSVPSTDRVAVQIPAEQWQIVNNGNFAFFSTSVQKTLLVNVSTDRASLISPPRNANGDIVDLNVNVRSVSQGSGATFKIATLENEELVFLATDVIGGNNAVGLPYLSTQVSGANSGVGFVDSLIVDSGGTGYSNNQVLSFNGGGFAGGEPLVPASATILTNGSGSIVDVQVTSHGQGYWTTPTVVWPGGNATANIDIVMDYGYGFPKYPNGDDDTLLVDLWTIEPFTIGTISSIGSINPGQGYNQDPFITVYNKYVAGFRRADFVITVSGTTGSFQVGETLTQTVVGDGGITTSAKGYVLVATIGQLIVRRTSFNTSFVDGIPIVGTSTGATATVERVETIQGGFVMGDNADVTGTVIAADGIARAVDVIDSGFGYEYGETLTLERIGYPYIMSGTASVVHQGVGSGFWKTKTSHLNSNAKIHDNKYYQEFSYDVITGKSLDRYQPILKKILHVAGMEMFGTVEKRSTNDIGAVASSQSTVSSVTSIG
jgi:hypothetical protein